METFGTVKEQPGMNRRSFLKLGGLAAGIAALSGVAAASGCSPTNASEQGSSESVEQGGIPYSVYDTDILLIGGGFGASHAMHAASQAGKSILLVEKAPYGFGGGCGMNFNIMQTWTPDAYYETEADVPDDMEFVRDWNLQKKTKVQNEIERNPEVVTANFGETLQDRNSDGTLYYNYDFPTVRGFEYSMTRNWTDFHRAKDFVTIHDRTLITDLIIEEGRCLGAVGLHLPTGEYRVYRAKAVVSSTGGSTQFFGWLTTACRSNNTLDNTFDVEASILRHGGQIADNEYCTYDLMSTWPTSPAMSNGGAMGADSVHSGFLYDTEGTRLQDYPEDVIPPELFSTQEGVIRAAQIVCDLGKGTENGGVLLRCDEEGMQSMRYMYTRNFDLFKAKWGLDMVGRDIEVIPEMYEHGGQPLVDENAMCRDFEGLFVVRSNSGSQGGNVNNTNRRMGRYAMMKAIEYVDSYEPLENATLSSAVDEIARLEDLRTRSHDDAIRPITIRRAIQNACAMAARPIRVTEELEKAKTELDRILSEDVPRMACSDNSRVYNQDWKDAIETLNVLEEARMFVYGSLEREESRASMIRPDFPETDDANWMCSLAYRRSEDGTLTSEKITY
ncbi:MAG: FAD-binding protein [Coriobacteriales bacterium]|jgi:succinate dehydrogenase/fumarate reductase flavoprotein subunit